MLPQHEARVSIGLRKRTEWSEAEVASVETKLASIYQGVRSARDVVGVNFYVTVQTESPLEALAWAAHEVDGVLREVNLEATEIVMRSVAWR